MSNYPVLNARQLRSLADAAASMRGPEGQPIYAVVTESSGVPVLSLVPGQPGGKAPKGTVLEIDTWDVQPERPEVTSINIAAGGPPLSLDEYDAVFWSEAAVEKFVLPYYASKSLWNAAEVLDRLSHLWYGFIPAGPGAPHPAAAGAAEIPFALAHIPDSEYVGIDEPQQRELHLLFRNPDGTISARSLPELWEEGGSRGTGDPAPRSPASPGAG